MEQKDHSARYGPVFEELSNYPFGGIVKIVFSASSGDVKKMTVKPLRLRGGDFWQCEKIIGDKAFHLNVEAGRLRAAIGDILELNGFSEINIFFADRKVSYHAAYGKNARGDTAGNAAGKTRLVRGETPLKKELAPEFSHDRKKNYTLPEGTVIPPLVDLGVLDSSGRVRKSKHGKFVQINRFIEIISGALKDFRGGELTIIDFGCGKSYLTFIVYYYFTFVRKIKTRIWGYDLKREVIEECRGVAERRGYSGIEFVEGDVSRVSAYPEKADMIISLHACDTATDYAIWGAIQNGVKYVFAVPCCQREINGQIEFRDEYSLFGRYGLYRERFSAAFTDCIRCEVLRNYGYEVEVVEFVDFSDSPKNAMIRAELKRPPADRTCADANRAARHFGVSQTLLNLVNGTEAGAGGGPGAGPDENPLR